MGLLVAMVLMGKSERREPRMVPAVGPAVREVVAGQGASWPVGEAEMAVSKEPADWLGALLTMGVRARRAHPP